MKPSGPSRQKKSLATRLMSYVYVIEDCTGRARYVGSGPWNRAAVSQSEHAHHGISTRYWYAFGPLPRPDARLLEKQVIHFFQSSGQCDWNRNVPNPKWENPFTPIPPDHPVNHPEQPALFKLKYHPKPAILGKTTTYDPQSLLTA